MKVKWKVNRVQTEQKILGFTSMKKTRADKIAVAWPCPLLNIVCAHTLEIEKSVAKGMVNHFKKHTNHSKNHYNYRV